MTHTIKMTRAGKAAPAYKMSRTAKAASVAALAVITSLSGCATLLGGNVKGNFACSAPGGSCAPTDTIDDRAIAGALGRSTSPATYQNGTEPSVNQLLRTALSAPAPIRTGEHVLRIVFPPHIDRAGRYREAVAVHAVVGRGRWAQTNARSQDPKLGFSNDLGLAELASSAPQVAFPDEVNEASVELSAVSEEAMHKEKVDPALMLASAKQETKRLFIASTTRPGAPTLGGEAANKVKNILFASPVAGKTPTVRGSSTASARRNFAGTDLQATLPSDALPSGTASAAKPAATSAGASATKLAPKLSAASPPVSAAIKASLPLKGILPLSAANFSGQVDLDGDK